MKKILLIGLILVAMMTLFTGTALANWGFDLVAEGDANGDMNDGANHWGVYYWSDGETLWSNGMQLWITEVGLDGLPADTATFTVDNGSGFGLAPLYMLMDFMTSNNNLSDFTWTYANPTANFDHNMATGTGIVNGDFICYIDSSIDTFIQWGQNNTFNVNENVGPENNVTLIKMWTESSSTPELSSGDKLRTDGTAGPTPGTPPEPTPPIPEIITIVLISMGLVALGAYVWYRRKRQHAMIAV